MLIVDWHQSGRVHASLLVGLGSLRGRFNAEKHRRGIQMTRDSLLLLTLSLGTLLWHIKRSATFGDKARQLFFLNFSPRCNVLTLCCIRSNISLRAYNGYQKYLRIPLLSNEAFSLLSSFLETIFVKRNSNESRVTHITNATVIAISRWNRVPATQEARFVSCHSKNVRQYFKP